MKTDIFLHGDVITVSGFAATLYCGGISKLYRAKLIVEKEVKKDISLLSCVLTEF